MHGVKQRSPAVNGPAQREVSLRLFAPEPPRGSDRLRWWGPGLLWAMSAVGSGSVLFTPRVGSEYRYELIWLLWLVAALMWVMIREAGRFTVATGRTLLDGFSTLPGPRHWALWIVFVPQLLAAVAGVGGLSALVGSALSSQLPGGLLLWSLVVLAGGVGVVVSGGYRTVSRAALVLALVLVAIAVVAAIGVFASPDAVAAGIVPSIPDEVDVPFVLPWIGTILAGSMGIVWFSYWTAARGFGGGATGEATTPSGPPPHDEIDITRRVNAWMSALSGTAAVGVVTGTVVITAFLVLGAELLAPDGIVPSGTDVADQLTRLLSDVWGSVGHWLMVAAIVVALGGSVLANQDGWSRSFADIVQVLRRRTDQHARLKARFAVIVTGVLPALVIVVVRDPVTIMAASGIVATIHTPFIVFATLAVNHQLPRAVRPGAVTRGVLIVAGVFYTAFAGLYFASMAGLFG